MAKLLTLLGGGTATAFAEPPVAIVLSNNIVAEDAEVEDVVGTASVSGSYTGTPTFTLAGDDAASFSLDTNTGVLTVNAALDYETAPTLDITIEVADIDPLPDTNPRAFTITVTDLSEPGQPTLTWDTDPDDNTPQFTVTKPVGSSPLPWVAADIVELQIDEDENFASPVTDTEELDSGEASSNTVIFTSEELEDGTYYVRARVTRPGGAPGPWSETVEVTIGAEAFTPLDVSPVVWFDPADIDTMKKERTGASATTAAEVDDVVGSWLNKGSLGGWAVAPADDARPILRNSGDTYWLDFDGTNDRLVLPTPGVGMLALEAFVAFEESSAVSNAGVVVLAPTSGNDYESVGALVVAETADGSNHYAAAGLVGNSFELAIAGSGATTLAVFELNMTSGSGTAGAARKNGAGEVTDTSVQNFDATHAGDLIIGARFLSGAQAAPYLNGNVFDIVIVNDTLDAGERTSMREYVADKAGVSL